MKHEPRPAIHMEKSVNSLGGPIIWVEHSLRGSQGREIVLSQVDGVSDMAPACWLCDSVGGGFRKETMASACLSVWEKAVPQLSP